MHGDVGHLKSYFKGRHGMDPDHVCDAKCVGRPRPYRVVHAHFPEWGAFQATVERELERTSDESTAFVGIMVTTHVPEVLVRDWRRVADTLGWPLGKVLGYLAVQGALRVVEQADRAAQG